MSPAARIDSAKSTSRREAAPAKAPEARRSGVTRAQPKPASSTGFEAPAISAQPSYSRNNVASITGLPRSAIAVIDTYLNWAENDAIPENHPISKAVGPLLVRNRDVSVAAKAVSGTKNVADEYVSVFGQKWARDAFAADVAKLVPQLERLFTKYLKT